MDSWGGKLSGEFAPGKKDQIFPTEQQLQKSEPASQLAL